MRSTAIEEHGYSGPRLRRNVRILPTLCICMVTVTVTLVLSTLVRSPTNVKQRHDLVPF